MCISWYNNWVTRQHARCNNENKKIKKGCLLFGTNCITIQKKTIKQRTLRHLLVIILLPFKIATLRLLHLCQKDERVPHANLTFIGPCIANVFAEYNQQDATFHNLFISVRRSTCFRWFFRPSSGAQNCIYSVRPIVLPAASLTGLPAGSGIGLSATWRCMCSFELLMMDGKHVWNM